MPPRKHRKQPRQQVVEQSDYDSEAFNTDTGAYNQTHTHPNHAAPLRTNEELNLAVLQRINPDVQQILSIASFAVVYFFSATTQSWEKSGVEGTLFICQLTPEVNQWTETGEAQGIVERYGVTVLNRKGLNNFSTELKSPGDVEVTDDYVILQTENEEGAGREIEGQVGIFGLWIFNEGSVAHAREVAAQVILECATRSENSRVAGEEVYAEDDADYVGEESEMPGGDNGDKAYDGQAHNAQNGVEESYGHSGPQTGRQVDLLSLFNKPSLPNAGGYTTHTPEAMPMHYQQQQHQMPSAFPHAHPPPAPQVNQAQSLLNLFKR